MSNRELSGEHANRRELGLHDLCSRGGHEPVNGCAVGVHLILAEAPELEQHGVQVTTPNDLLLDRFLDTIDRNELVAD
jgi:hypothetical protein